MVRRIKSPQGCKVLQILMSPTVAGDYLEQKVTIPVIDSFYRSLTKQDKLYVTRDEVFLEHILDDEDKLQLAGMYIVRQTRQVR
jgi:hypothetical protein